jgi:hypothetical protein
LVEKKMVTLMQYGGKRVGITIKMITGDIRVA